MSCIKTCYLYKQSRTVYEMSMSYETNVTCIHYVSHGVDWLRLTYTVLVNDHTIFSMLVQI